MASNTRSGEISLSGWESRLVATLLRTEVDRNDTQRMRSP